jgi:hypothetical protein
MPAGSKTKIRWRPSDSSSAMTSSTGRARCRCPKNTPGEQNVQACGQPLVACTASARAVLPSFATSASAVTALFAWAKQNRHTNDSGRSGRRFWASLTSQPVGSLQPFVAGATKGCTHSGCSSLKLAEAARGSAHSKSRGSLPGPERECTMQSGAMLPCLVLCGL